MNTRMSYRGSLTQLKNQELNSDIKFSLETVTEGYTVKVLIATKKSGFCQLYHGQKQFTREKFLGEELRKVSHPNKSLSY